MTQIPSKSAGMPVGAAAERGPGWSDTRLLLRRLREVMASEAEYSAKHTWLSSCRVAGLGERGEGLRGMG